MPKFFVNSQQIQKNVIFIEKDDANHMISVLRMKKNDKVLVCDGQNTDYECIIKNIGKDVVELEIEKIMESKTEPHIKVTLYQGLPKADKMELIIQKCVELGVSKIVPMATDRAIVKIEDGKKSEKKIERWNKISESAAKQSQRSKIPEVTEVVQFSKALEQALNENDSVIIPYENEEGFSLKQFLTNFEGNSIAVFIGPEGGFADKEIKLVKQKGINTVTLGNRILRTETAGLVTIANIMYEKEL